jgi:hypothetical protein
MLLLLLHLAQHAAGMGALPIGTLQGPLPVAQWAMTCCKNRRLADWHLARPKNDTGHTESKACSRMSHHGEALSGLAGALHAALQRSAKRFAAGITLIGSI